MKKTLVILSLLFSFSAFSKTFFPATDTNLVTFNQHVNVHCDSIEIGFGETLSKVYFTREGEFNTTDLKVNFTTPQIFKNFRYQILNSELFDQHEETVYMMGRKRTNEIQVYAVKVQLKSDDVLGYRYTGCLPAPLHEKSAYIFCYQNRHLD